CYRAWDFERPRHGEPIKLRPGLFEHLRGTRQQRIGDVIVKPRLDHKNTSAPGAVLLVVFAATRFGHSEAPIFSARFEPKNEFRLSARVSPWSYQEQRAVTSASQRGAVSKIRATYRAS